MARKRSQSKKSVQKGSKRMQWILLSFFGALIVIAAILIVFSIFNSSSLLQKNAASVNGEPITQEELMRSYGMIVPKEFQSLMTPYHFLNESIIPQKLLLQASQKHGISITEEEIDSVISSLLEANALTQEDLKNELASQDLTLKDFKETYRVRLAIAQYLNETIFSKISVTEKEVRDAYASGPYQQFNYSLIEAAPYIRSQLLEEERDMALTAHIEELRSQSTIEIMLQEEGPISTFTATADSCAENGLPLIRAYTVSTCEECDMAINALKDLLISYEGELSAHIWELDTGDDLMSEEIESKVPTSELTYFKSISPKNLVPAYSFGCEYVRVGHQSAPPLNLLSESAEFSSLLEALLQHEQ